jgi:phage gpG-like protein
MSLTGDFGRLDRLVSGVGDLAVPAFRRKVLAASAPVLGALVRAGFGASMSPAGARWKRLARPRHRSRPNKGGPLYDAGNLREQATGVSVIGDGLLIFVTAPGAVVHQYGGRFIPARPYLPRRTLPASWLAGINLAATQVLRISLR